MADTKHEWGKAREERGRDRGLRDDSLSIIILYQCYNPLFHSIHKTNSNHFLFISISAWLLPLQQLLLLLLLLAFSLYLPRLQPILFSHSSSLNFCLFYTQDSVAFIQQNMRQQTKWHPTSSSAHRKTLDAEEQKPMNVEKRRWFISMGMNGMRTIEIKKRNAEKTMRQQPHTQKIADEANWKIKLQRHLWRCDDKSSFFEFSTN